LVSNHGTIVILTLTKEPIRIPTMPFVHRDIKIVSSFQGGRKDVKEMLAFTAKHEIHPWIVKVAFDKINDAIELKKQRTARYCIVLEADESKEKGSNIECYKAIAEQYLKD
jgi:D-arabinose 1-dehydrogenase-like Zn-dependent alcohol dehydrogenase